MNLFLWVLQIVLAFLYLTGGAYKTFQSGELATLTPVLSPGGWRALGMLEMVGAVLLVVPAAMKWVPVLTPLAATVLAVETLIMAGLYSRQSLDLAVTNPLVWALAMGVPVAFVAYGRFTLAPV